jgi:hypothetical protein
MASPLHYFFFPPYITGIPSGQGDARNALKGLKVLSYIADSIPYVV